MNETGYVNTIKEQTQRALWEVNNVIDCVDHELWNRCYCEMPMWKHIYHMLHSLDQWFINPKEYREPDFHTPNLNNLDAVSEHTLGKAEIQSYFAQVQARISRYLDTLTDEQLLQQPENCEYTRFTLILAQHRHLHSHMGMIMGFIIDDTGMWPRVVGLEGIIPEGDYEKFF